MSLDPTRTTSLRKKTISRINARYRVLKGLVNASIIENDIFDENSFFSNVLRPIPKGSFDTLDEVQKQSAFNEWISLTSRELLDLPDEEKSDEYLLTHWLLSSIAISYLTRAISTNKAFHTKFPSKVPDRSSSLLFALDKAVKAPPRAPIVKSGTSVFVERAVISPVPKSFISPVPKPVTFSPVPKAFTFSAHEARLNAFLNRDFRQLQGLNEEMIRQIDFVISEGILQNQNPTKIARSINKKIDTIGRTRSRLIARTEINKANNTAIVVEGDLVGKEIGEDDLYLWQTAEDEKVRSSHRLRNKKVYTKDKVLTLIGEPNCRCKISIVFKSKLPKDQKIIS